MSNDTSLTSTFNQNFVMRLSQLEQYLLSGGDGPTPPDGPESSKQALMTKKISELTPEELDGLRKILGVPGRPYPMVGPTQVEGENGEKIAAQVLGLLEDPDNPLEIYSERTYAEVLGIAYREMPIPSMLPMFYRGLLFRRIDSNRRIQFIKGEPGAGKSHMAKMVARMCQNTGAVVVDCGGKDLSQLLWETVLDFSRDTRFYVEMDQRMAKGNLSAYSVSELRNGLGSLFTEETLADGKKRYAIDWSMIGKVVATDGTAAFNEGVAKKQLAALEAVRAFEGLGAGNSNPLGMTVKEGVLLRCYKAGTPVILDEYNKSKAGTDDRLQTVLQFFNGEISECVVENHLKSKDDNAAPDYFTLKREDMKPGWFVTLTGNDSVDGVSTRELNRSVYSRIDVEQVPVFSIEDWQHRICQIMTGVPVSTLYKTSQAQWDKNPEAFRRKLIEWRKMALSPEEVKNLPPIQIALLDNWQNIIDASEKLARFYFGWSQAVNPNSKMMQNPNMAEIVLEIDEQYAGQVSIDFRRIIKDIEEGLRIKAAVTPLSTSGGYDTGSWEKPPTVEKQDREDPALRFGTRLTEALLSKVNATTADMGKRALHAYLMKLAADCGLTEPDLKEGMKSSHYRTLAELLDMNPYRDNRPDAQVRLVQSLVCDYLRERFPGIQVTNDEIVAKARVKAALGILKDVDPSVSSHSSLFYVPNPDVSAAVGKPFVAMVSADGTPGPVSSGPIGADKLVDHESVLATLAMPVIGKHNLTALWNKALSASGVMSSGADGVIDEALAMAQGESASGLAIASVVTSRDVNGTVREQVIHIVRDAARERTLIIGGPISRRLEGVFKSAGIDYVDTTKERSVSQLDMMLARILRNRPPEQADQLKSALLLRNELPKNVKTDDLSLAQILVRPDLKCEFPHYLTATPATPPGGNPPTAQKRAM